MLQEEYYEYRMCELWAISRKKREKLLELFGTAEELLHAGESEVEHLEFLTKRDRRGLLDELRREREGAGEASYESFLNTGGRFTSIHCEDYPMRLRTVSNAPYGLFYYGSLPAEEKIQVSIVGARACSEYGRTQSALFAGEAVRAGAGVISGMAYGIDTEAGMAALENGGYSAAVLGCGIDVCYPASSQDLYWRLRESGGIISEFSFGTQPLAQHFPARNRIISGLCDALLVVEARRRSGSLITADMALDQGRDVYAIPGRVGDDLSDGCNQLIHQGAGIASDPLVWLSDIGARAEETYVISGQKYKPIRKVRPYAAQLKAKIRTEPDPADAMSLTGDERKILHLAGADPRPIDYYVREGDMPYLQVLGILVDLQVKGLLKENGRDYYCRV